MTDYSQILPDRARDGQIYINPFGIKYVYSADEDSWIEKGVVHNLPVVRTKDDPEGPTNGLLSREDKAQIDNIDEKAGKFGIILKPGRYVTPENGVDSVLSGDVKLVSESITFDCGANNISFSISDKFFNNFQFDAMGQKGPKGNKGEKGVDGLHGTGDGPEGETGEAGEDAAKTVDFSGIKINNLTQLYNVGVTELDLNADAGKLTIIKSRVTTPEDDVPADRVIATPIYRNVIFTNSSDFNDWIIETNDPDPPNVDDIDVLMLPSGWSPDESQPIVTVKLSNLIAIIIDYYQNLLTDILSEWDKQSSNFIRDKDEISRQIITQLAQQVIECEFDKPLEVCVTLGEPCDETSTVDGGQQQ